MLSTAEVPVHRLTSAEYERIVASGALADVRLELLDGLLVEVRPQGPEQQALVDALSRLLAGRKDLLRVGLRLACADGWEPEADVALALPVEGDHQPSSARLAIEVAVTSQAQDLRKLTAYAVAGIPVVWLIDVPARCVHVLRDPRGDHYAHETFLHDDDVLDPGIEGLERFSVAALFDAAGAAAPSA